MGVSSKFHCGIPLLADVSSKFQSGMPLLAGFSSKFQIGIPLLAGQLDLSRDQTRSDRLSEPKTEALPQALARAVPVTRLTGTAQQVQDIERSMQVSTPARVVPGPPALPLGQLTPAVIQSFEDRTRVALPAFHERLKPITEGVKVTEDPEGALGYTPDEIRRLQIEADITGERLKLTEQRAARGGDPKKRRQQAASLSRDPTDVPTGEPVVAPAPAAATALVPAPVQAQLPGGGYLLGAASRSPMPWSVKMLVVDYTPTPSPQRLRINSRRFSRSWNAA